MKNLRRFWNLIKQIKIKNLTIFVFVLSNIVVLVPLLYPIIIKNIIDILVGSTSGSLVEKEAINHLFSQLFLFVGASFGTIIAQLINNYYSYLWYIRLYNEVSKSAFSHIHSLSMTYFEKEMSGSIKEKTGQGVNDMTNITDQIIGDIIPQITVMLFAGTVLYRVNPFLTLITFMGFPIFVLISKKMTKVLNRKQDKVRGIWEKASGRVMQSIIGIKTVKSYNREDFEIKDYNDKVNQTFDINRQRTLLRQKLNFFRFMIILVSRVSVIGFSSYLAIKGKISVGEIYLFFAYNEKVYGPLFKLSWTYDMIHERMRSVLRILDLFDEKPEVVDIPNAKILKKVKGIIQFKNVNFGYSSKNVLKNINFSVGGGETIALVGPSGVGKSTIAKLLMRLHDLSSGQIFIDGHNISQVTQKSLRENVGVVLQDTTLFNSSVKDNIKYGNLKAKTEDIVNAAKIANADDFIIKLPKRYNTEVGERGVKLSGGEQQRINIARAVLKNAPILILDEATSHLDSESERLVQEALWRLIKGRTTIIIAHRLATVMRADKILVLDKGKIVEDGTHQELIKNDGLYAKLFKIQSGAMLLTDKEEESSEKQ